MYHGDRSSKNMLPTTYYGHNPVTNQPPDFPEISDFMNNYHEAKKSVARCFLAVNNK